jgi:hypothetical protein
MSSDIPALNAELAVPEGTPRPLPLPAPTADLLHVLPEASIVPRLVRRIWCEAELDGSQSNRFSDGQAVDRVIAQLHGAGLEFVGEPLSPRGYRPAGRLLVTPVAGHQ